MVGIYSSTNNGLESSGKVSYWNLAKSTNPIKLHTNTLSQNNFANAVYGDGPHSLLRPACASDILAQNLDIIS